MWSKKRIVWFVLMIATMAIIFYFSNQPGEKSGAVGNAVAQSMNIPPTNPWVDESHTKLLFGLNLRKWAHIGLFAILGCCAVGLTVSGMKAVGICFCYAVFDELHQLFVDGRDARIEDIFIDAIGFLAVALLYHVWQLLKRKYWLRCEETNSQ